jgi:hypothetical protein
MIKLGEKPDTRYKMQDTGYRILDTGNLILAAMLNNKYLVSGIKDY